MSEIDILLHCANRFCEVPSESVSVAECVVEELTSLTLITLFESIVVHEVALAFSDAEQQVTISIHAQGHDPLPGVDLAHLDCVLEDRISCALVELFGLLNVDRCAVC